LVATQGGDAFIFDMASGTVLHAIHGMGHWLPTAFAPDMTSFAACLGVISMALRGPEEVYDDDFEIRPEWSLVTRRRLATLLGDDGQAEVIMATLGLTA
jgi:hypothetical protein